MRFQNWKCLDATCKAWEVPFPAIWEAFSAKFFFHATRQPMVALRLDSGPNRESASKLFWPRVPPQAKSKNQNDQNDLLNDC